MVRRVARPHVPLDHPRPYLPPPAVHEAQVRLSRLEGHVRAVSQMLAERRDCLDVLTQLVAVRAALTGASVRLLEAHVETCLQAAWAADDLHGALVHLRAALTAALGNGK